MFKKIWEHLKFWESPRVAKLDPGGKVDISHLPKYIGGMQVSEYSGDALRYMAYSNTMLIPKQTVPTVHTEDSFPAQDERMGICLKQ